MELKYCALSDIGPGRPNNEDAWGALPDIGFFALADGMGGHRAGEVASAEAVDSLCNSLRSTQSSDSMEWIIELRHAIEKANWHIYQMGKRSNLLTGMGTTLCCLIWTKHTVVYAHVGDSRIYRMRQKKLELLTIDHSFFSKWQAFGKLADECETPYPYKNVITRAIGTSKQAKPEISVTSHEPGDLYFLCTDGVSDVLATQEMEQIVNSSSDLSGACENVIEKAKIKGSSDNMTLLMIQSSVMELCHAKNLSG